MLKSFILAVFGALVMASVLDAQQPCETQVTGGEVVCINNSCSAACTRISYQDSEGITWTYCVCNDQSSVCCGLQVGGSAGIPLYQTTGYCEPLAGGAGICNKGVCWITFGQTTKASCRIFIPLPPLPF